MTNLKEILQKVNQGQGSVQARQRPGILQEREADVAEVGPGDRVAWRTSGDRWSVFTSAAGRTFIMTSTRLVGELDALDAADFDHRPSSRGRPL